MPKQKQRMHASMGSVSEDITLASMSAQKLYQRHFKDVSMKAYHIAWILRVNGFDSESDEAEKIIADWFNEIHNGIIEENKRLDELKANKGITTKANYSNVRVYTAEYTSLYASRFVAILKELDKLTANIDILWLVGDFDSNQKSRAIYKWERAIVKMANRIKNLSQSLKKLTKQQGSSKKAETKKAASKPEEKSDVSSPAVEPELATA